MAEIQSTEAKSLALRNQRVFNNPEGKEFVKDLIVRSRLFSSIDPTDAGAIVERNLCLEFLATFGTFQDSNIDKLVDSLLSVSYNEE